MVDENDTYSADTDDLAQLRKDLERQTAKQSRIDSRPISAQARLNITPSAIPSNTFDPSIVIAVLKEEFNATLDKSDIQKYLPSGAPAISDELALSIAIQNEDFVVFKGGWLRLSGNDRVTPIKDMRFATQNVSASVAGTSDEALYLCRRLLILLWQAAGVQRQWAELEPDVEIESYMTETVVDLGVPLIQLTSPLFQKFVNDRVVGADGYGQDMGLFASRRRQFSAAAKTIPYVNTIDMRLAIVDEISGEQEECTLGLMIHSRGDANRTRVRVASELHSTRHSQMVEQLIGVLRSPK